MYGLMVLTLARNTREKMVAILKKIAADMPGCFSYGEEFRFSGRPARSGVTRPFGVHTTCFVRLAAKTCCMDTLS
jgi:hypothetical protein